MKAALDSGNNYWNGGELYGGPDSNSLTLLRRYFDKYPDDADKVVINIKGCVDPLTYVLDASAEGVKKSIENCLNLLGPKGKISQFESARKDPTVEIEETVKAIDEFVKAGKIGGVSLSEVGPETIRRAAKVTKIGSVEIEFSLWTRDPMHNGILETCKELDIPVLAYGKSTSLSSRSQTLGC
jgi:pyridoxine 4-dehydrogenase